MALAQGSAANQHAQIGQEQQIRREVSVLAVRLDGRAGLEGSGGV